MSLIPLPFFAAGCVSHSICKQRRHIVFIKRES